MATATTTQEFSMNTYLVSTFDLNTSTRKVVTSLQAANINAARLAFWNSNHSGEQASTSHRRTLNIVAGPTYRINKI
jgi:hypothetical protein